MGYRVQQLGKALEVDGINRLDVGLKRKTNSFIEQKIRYLRLKQKREFYVEHEYFSFALCL